MSHNWNCPTEWEARHEGERAKEYGRSRSSNPYEDDFLNRNRACPEAAEAWSSGYRRAEIREEEQLEDAAAQHRAEMRRRQEHEAEESYYMDRQAEADYYAMQQEQYAEDDIRDIDDAQGQDKP